MVELKTSLLHRELSIGRTATWRNTVGVDPIRTNSHKPIRAHQSGAMISYQSIREYSKTINERLAMRTTKYMYMFIAGFLDVQLADCLKRWERLHFSAFIQVVFLQTELFHNRTEVHTHQSLSKY